MKNAHINFSAILLLLFIPLTLVAFFHYSRLQITPNEDFFVLQKGEIPQIDKSDWTLKIFGHVKKNLTFDYESFTNLDSKKIIATLECVEGYFATAEWEGVLLKDILTMAEIQEGAYDIVFYAEDGYTDSLTLEQALESNVLLAYKMNNETLPKEHGFPVRLVAPDHYGYKWVKWIVNIEIVKEDYIGFWEKRGWSDTAMRSNFSSWIIHAYMFSFGLILAGLSYISGKKITAFQNTYKNLPNFITRKFHIWTSVSFLLFSIISFGYWTISTINLRGAIFYSIHGLIGLIMLIILLSGTMTLVLRFWKYERIKKLHRKISSWGFYFYLISILIGLFNAYFGSLIRQPLF